MEGVQLLFGIIPVVVIVLYIVFSSFRILREYERGVIFRFGRRTNAIFNPGGDGSGPGLVLLIPFIDKMVKVSLQTVALDVPPQDVITRDNVSIKVSAVIYFRVLDPEKAVIAVQDYLYATSQISQTTLRSVLGQVELDDLLSARDKINQQLQRIIDAKVAGEEVVATVEEAPPKVVNLMDALRQSLDRVSTGKKKAAKADLTAGEKPERVAPKKRAAR